MADAKIVIIGGAADDQDHDIPDNTDPAWRVHQGATDYIAVDTSEGEESVRLVSSGTGNAGVGAWTEDYSGGPPMYPLAIHGTGAEVGGDILEIRSTGTDRAGGIAIRSDDGDPRIRFQGVGGSTKWVMGSDEDDSYAFKIDQHNAVGSDTKLEIDLAGTVTIPGGEFHVTNGDVGIGTTDPTHLLSVSGGDVSISDTTPVLELRDSRNNPGATDLGAISFTSSDASAGDDYCATIVCESINGTAKPDGALRFTMFENGIANGVVRMENNGDVSIQKAGTAESIVDFLTLENTVNAATMDGTGSAIHFKQYYYDASSPATEDSAKITVATETNWTSTASTRDSYMAFQTSNGGTLDTRMRISSSGNVGVAKTADSAVRMDVSGAVGASTGYYVREILDPNHIDDRSNGSGSATLYIGDEPINTTSDRRIKKNIVDTSANALDTLDKVRVVDFEWDDPSDVTNGKNARGAWTGVIAQEVIDHIPYAVNAPRDPQTMEPLPDAKRLDNEGNEFDQLWLLNYGNIVPLLIKAVQELKSEIAQLKEGN